MEAKLLGIGERNDGVLAVLQQLRSQYTFDSLHQQIEKQQAAGYQIVYAHKEGEVVGVAGFVMGEKLAWGNHIYIDDLVTSEHCRNTGVGTFLLQWFKRFAKQNAVQQIHLDSGVQRFAAHRFYLREGFNIASHHFSMLDV
ncbi:GNAT family N-acetyltransferase [Pseudoalteromonas pernae]|uniref:GNAT family N-acetyltransferase n=1 Tax=Pseudoalteromonas pernae TaxID=3118054 RepID=UPI003242FF40